MIQLQLFAFFRQAHLIGKKERPPFFDAEPPVMEPEPKKDIPSELMCSLCNDLLRDAVLIPCCGYSFCDECIRNRLLGKLTFFAEATVYVNFRLQNRIITSVLIVVKRASVQTVCCRTASCGKR